jgi:histidyl-tRNA synthetase
LCEDCRNHFSSLKEGLTSAGIEFVIDTGIVRGLDYYTKTVFEFIQKDTGLALLAGGRYDGLVNELDERQNVSGLGFASGIERLINVMEQSGLSFGNENDKEQTIDVYIANIGQKGGVMAADIARKLRSLNIKTEIDIMNRSIKAQMKYADKIGAKYTIAIGDDEVDNRKIIVKNMKDGSQTPLNASEAAEYINNNL